MRSFLSVLFLLPLTVSAQDLVPWGSNHHSSDKPKQHVQDISSGPAEYTVVQSGTMDGRNCRSPQGVWTPFEQTWESNRAVRLENVGETDVVNPWLSNGRNTFRNNREIIAHAIEPGMTDQEKAFALWWQQIQLRYHFGGDNDELMCPVKVLNVYGHNTCGNDSICLGKQWATAGLKVAPARVVGHCITQVFYDGDWHLFDGDMHSMFLLRDNKTVAGELEIVHDHDLVKRTHSQGILRPDERAGDEWESSVYVYEGPVTGDRNFDLDNTMNMTLRPGEALVWRWGHLEPYKHHGDPQHRFPERICNGLWEYRPDFSKDAWRKGADSVEGIKSGSNGLTAEQGKTGVIVWTMRAPYVFVGGKLDVAGTGANFEISWDGKKWEKIGQDLDKLFTPNGKARYEYKLKCQLTGDAHLKGLGIINDLQMAPLSLPEMSVGTNTFTYTDETPGDRQIRITHNWVERSASAPPAAPAAPISPPNQGDFEGTDVVFQWQPAVDPDKNKIADYHFELSARPDMKWPLSMSFAKLISRTADAGKARYALTAPGELNPNRTYYWHVRAKDDQGVWGPWSETWSFTPHGPTYPLDVTLQYDSQKNLGTLKWKPNPIGRRPVAYRIYASDEKGFSTSDEPYKVVMGEYNVHDRKSSDQPADFPANFVVETQGTELAVVGPDVKLPGANKAFFRVVAVDEKGERSGPSDYAAAPRPVIYSQPVVKAKKGTPYSYAVSAIRSLGDLRMRQVQGKETLSFWDVEQPRYRLEKGPKWLKLDETTGRLTGKPTTAGKSEVVIAVTLEREQHKLDEEILKWGNEKILASGTEKVGEAKQSFVIDTGP